MARSKGVCSAIKKNSSASAPKPADNRDARAETSSSCAPSGNRASESVDFEAAARFAAIVDSSDDAIICKNLDGVIVFWNRSAARLFGYRANEIIGKPMTVLIPRDRLLEEDLILQRLRRGERIDRYQTVRVAKDGRLLDVSISVTPVHDQQGRVTGAAKIVRDIMSARVAEQELRDSEARTRAIVRTAADAIITIDDRGIVESANPAAERLFGYRESELIGKNVSLLMPEPFSSEHDRYLKRYAKTGRAKIIGIGREVAGLKKDGSIFPMGLAVSELRLAGRRMFTGIVHDLTDRRRLEREIIEASGNEQRRIGQDLHDGLCQQLAGVGFGVELLARRLETRSPADAAAARKLGENVRDAITQARQLARGLNPVNLDRLGLAASLKDLTDKIAETCKIKCAFSTSGEIPTINGSNATHLYRIAQEAVNNANRHGKATRIALHLAVARGTLTLTVTDNGCGFPREEAMQSRGGTDLQSAPRLAAGGMGLHSMNYRARLMGGAFNISPAPRGGTVVTCIVPLKPDPSADPTEKAPDRKDRAVARRN